MKCGCKQCGRELTADEIALYRRIVDRGAEAYLCISCFARAYDVTEDLLLGKIRHFRAMGCTLFL